MNTESFSFPPLSLPAADPFTSISALRRRHSALLRRQHSENDADRPHLEDLQHLIAQVKATGRKLASQQSREAAQDVLDYWVGIMLAKRSDLACGFGMLELDQYQGGGEEPTDSDHEAVARVNAQLSQAAIGVEKSLYAKQADELRVLLLRLFRLGATSQEVTLALLPANDPLSKTSSAKEILEKLQEAGVIRTEGTGKDLAYVLGHESLLTAWPLLKKLCDQRTSLREMASGWDKGGGQTAALLNGGDQLKEALDFADLNPIEQAFVEQSRRQSEKRRKIFWVAMTLILMIVVGVFIKAYMDVRLVNSRLVERNAQLKAEKDRAEATARELQIALTQAQEALKAGESLKTELQQAQTILKSVELSQLPPSNVSLQTNIIINPAEQKRRQEALTEADQSLSNVKRALSNQFSPRYKLKF